MSGVGGYLRLDHESLQRGLAALTSADPHLAAVVAQHGSPPLWARQPGFATLVHIILEQQVSLASARAAFDRLVAAIEPLTPDRFLTLDDVALRTFGFSRQKTAYTRALAEALVTGQLDLDRLAQQDDATIKQSLIALKGIGHWTADIYLLMALGRPDVWPAGDLALQIAAQKVKGLPIRPTGEEMIQLAEPWRPWRAVAARVLWQHYLSTR